MKSCLEAKHAPEDKGTTEKLKRNFFSKTILAAKSFVTRSLSEPPFKKKFSFKKHKRKQKSRKVKDAPSAVPQDRENEALANDSIKIVSKPDMEILVFDANSSSQRIYNSPMDKPGGKVINIPIAYSFEPVFKTRVANEVRVILDEKESFTECGESMHQLTNETASAPANMAAMRTSERELERRQDAGSEAVALVSPSIMTELGSGPDITTICNNVLCRRNAKLSGGRNEGRSRRRSKKKRQSSHQLYH